MSPDEFGLYRLLFDTANLAYPLALFGLQYTWNQSIAATDTVAEQSKEKGAALILCIGICLLAIASLTFGANILDKVAVLGQYSILIPFAFVISVPIFRDLAEGILVAQRKLTASAVTLVGGQVLVLSAITVLSQPLHIEVVAYASTLTVVSCSILGIALTGVSFQSLSRYTHYLLKTNLYFGLPVFAAASIVVLGQNTLQLATGLRLDAIEYGRLSLALMIASMVTLVPSAIAKAKFRDFATSAAIGNLLILQNVGVTLIAAIGLELFALVYVYLVAGKTYVELLKYLPFLLLSASLQGQADLFNRFFYAKNKAKVLTNISIILGTLSTAAGLALIHYFGVWGVVATKLLTSGLVLILYCMAYIRHLSSQLD